METGVPRSLATAAAIAWRVLVLAVAVVVLGLALAKLRLVFLPIFGALLVATLLVPLVGWLRGRGTPDSLAALAVLLGALVIGGGIAAGLAPQVVGQLNDLDVSVSGGTREIERWLVEGPLGLSDARVGDLFDQAEQQIRDSSGMLASGALSGALIVLEVITAVVLGIVVLFFFLKDGARIWSFVVGLFPARARDDVRGMGERAWTTLGGFLRGTAAVAFFDAVFIGLALYLVGVPLVIPLAVLTFFGGFVPIVGAFVAGFASAMVALVSNGPTAALIIVGATILVQQIEGNLLQPVVVGRSVELHPLAILLAVTTGGILWGILGAFVAVPLTAAAWAAISYLRERSARPRGSPPPSSFPERGRPEAGRLAG